MESEFKRVHPGPRWELVFGSFDGVERSAVVALQQILQYYVPYTLVVRPAGGVRTAELEHAAVIGTPSSNTLLAGLIAAGHLVAPDGEEGYSLALLDSPWKPGCRLLAVAGTDERGALYGAHEAAARLFSGGTLLDGFGGADRAGHPARSGSFADRESPSVRNRGLWTWGYAITSYRGYLDNMARLKMNALTIWNDRVPHNMRDVIEAAHARGIRVTLGFHWGWGHKGSLDLSSAGDRRRIRETVLETYASQYADLPHDGIYFQTLTEHKDLELRGRSTAHWACQLANETAGALLERHPGLAIQFGLHATSIGENYRDLAGLDPRVAIVWEDCCGQIPYTYHPAQDVEVTADFETMLDYSRRIAAFRPGLEFSLVPKGWTCIRWQNDFENHGAFILGEQNRLRSRERLMMRQNEWDRINAHWFENFPLAARFYRELLAVNPVLSATGLVEDGLFEEMIQPSVALFAETIWNPARPDGEILRRALRPYYRRIPA